MRLRTGLKLFALVAFAAFLYGGYVFNEARWGRKLQPANAILPDNTKYYGEIVNGLLEGPGELVGADGRRYKGQFHQGLMHGEGEFSDHQMRYQGGFERGMLNGKGTLEYAKGMRYIGEFKDNLMHGLGKLEWPNGDVFEGEFAADEMVRGKFRDQAGGVYDGGFADGLYHGQGVYLTREGDRYEGEFSAGSMTGKGSITRTDDSRYTGEVRDWIYHGKGELVDADGNTFIGSFEHGEYHGEGELRLKQPVDGVEVLRGAWSYGELAEDPRTPARSAQTLEKILYSQVELLDQRAAALANQTPGAPDFYFLGIAGDGTQEIFYRELKFVQQVLTDKFQLGERSLLLVNNLRAADQHPLATRISLQRGVAAVAQKMDPAQDVLVVYLTSHGSEDHKIYTAIPGLELPPIANTELAEILNQAPVQWKIVIVSACYSGGFMPGLQNDNTLVITASRADRQSFGCDDKNEMTYFARAYFKEALAQTPDFIQAFERAQVLIKEWEEKDFPDDERSEPQIFIGAKIRAHLSGQNK